MRKKALDAFGRVDILVNNAGDTWAWFKSRIPLGRFQTPKDIGEMAAFLASDRAENITGAAFNVDGGWEMH